jgi:hypothetical protein
MTEGNIRQWCRLFKDWRNNVNDKKRIGWPFVVSDDLVQSVAQKICERRRFTISEFSCEFPQISRTVLYEIIIATIGYHHKSRTRWVPKLLTGEHNMQRMDLP